MNKIEIKDLYLVFGPEKQKGVNDQYYTFDITDMESKANMVALLNKKTSSLGEAG